MGHDDTLNVYLTLWELADPQLLAQTRTSHIYTVTHGAETVILKLMTSSDSKERRGALSLRHFDESPQLPSGYGLMLGLAYLPPLWRRVMDRRVLALYDGDVTRANIEPSRRDRVLARYGAPGPLRVADPQG